MKYELYDHPGVEAAISEADKIVDTLVRDLIKRHGNSVSEELIEHYEEQLDWPIGSADTVIRKFGKAREAWCARWSGFGACDPESRHALARRVLKLL